jgi:hypothetical protein
MIMKVKLEISVEIRGIMLPCSLIFAEGNKGNSVIRISCKDIDSLV